jgi:MFS family permease
MFYIQMTMTAWFLGVALPQLFFGIIADKYGRRPMMLWGGILFLASTVLCALAPLLSVLILGRFLQGVGVSSLNVATYATVKSPHYDEKTSIKLLSYINTSGFLAPIIGPVLGGFIYYYFGWRATFIFIFLLSSAAIIGLYYYLFESVDEEKKHTIQFKFKCIWDSYRPIIVDKKIRGCLLTQSFLMGSLIAYLISAPFIMRQTFSIPIQYFGLTQIVPFSFFLLGGWFLTRLINFMEIRKIIKTSFILIFFSIILFTSTLFFPLHVQLYLFIAATSVYLSGFSLISSLLISEIISKAQLKAFASAFMGLCMATIAIVSSVLIAIFFKSLVDFIIIMNMFLIGSIVSYYYFYR